MAAKLDELSDLIDQIDDLQFLKDEYRQRIQELAVEITELHATGRKPFEDILASLIEPSPHRHSKEVDKEFDQAIAETDAYSSQMLKLADEHKLLTMKLETLENHIASSRKAAGEALLRQEIGPPQQHPTPYPATKPAKPTPRLSQIIDEFIAFKRSGKKKFGMGAVEGYQSAVTDLIFVVGDLPVDEVTFDLACAFREAEQKLPKHRNKNAIYRDKTSAELIALNLPRSLCISARTTSERLGALRGIYAWMTASGRADRNPFDGVSCEYDENPIPQFTPKDLNEIFSSPLYVDSSYSRSKFVTAAHWWLPLLSLWSGARPSELVQLRLDDVHKIDGILTAEVVDDEETGQRGKTKAARRIFPIHPALLELGLEDYITRLRRSGADRVLDSVKLGVRKPGSEAGKWFNERYRESHLPAHMKTEGKVLYSFRCTYITEALNSGVELRNLQQMVGHEKTQLKATKSYDRGQTIQALRHSINLINFSELNLSCITHKWDQMKRL